MHKISARFSVPYEFPVYFVDNIFTEQDETISEILSISNGKVPVVFPIIEKELLHKSPDLAADVKSLLKRLGLPAIPALEVQGGELGKNTPNLIPLIIDKCIEYQIDRHSYILAIGGGAFIDMVGYAAAITHRGIRLIRMPTTVLGQNDAGVGVKNAINYQGRKNFLGTFSPPNLVINDYHFIETLAERDKRAGIAEAIKVALIKDKAFFVQLVNNTQALFEFKKEAMKNMIAQCAELHLTHICHNGDPFERGSARPLDFGHWSAHALEEVSNFNLRHGEAVAIGILLDSRYSYYMNWISEAEYNQIESLIYNLGFKVCKSSVLKLNIIESLDNFREHLGGELCITMLKSIGYCHEVNEIDSSLMQTAVNYLLSSKLSKQ